MIYRPTILNFGHSFLSKQMVAFMWRDGVCHVFSSAKCTQNCLKLPQIRKITAVYGQPTRVSLYFLDIKKFSTLLNWNAFQEKRIAWGFFRILCCVVLRSLLNYFWKPLLFYLSFLYCKDFVKIYFFSWKLF